MFIVQYPAEEKHFIYLESDTHNILSKETFLNIRKVLENIFKQLYLYIFVYLHN